MTTQGISIPRPFFLRRIHSLMGLWLVIYLLEHLLTNSQAALWLGEDGEGFIHMVNFLQGLPYLQVIETLLLAIPIGVHGYLGIQYALSSKGNAHFSKGDKPSLFFYERNRAYSLQRWTSWILVIGILFHVAQMRFWLKPKETLVENQKVYMVPLNFDPGLYTLSARLNVELYSSKDISSFQEKPKTALSFFKERSFHRDIYEKKVQEQTDQQYQNWLYTLQQFTLTNNQVVAVCSNPGTAILLTTRDTFKSPWMGIFYTLFVLAAVFHAGNGVWTFLITWGAILSMRSQNKAVRYCWGLILLLGFLGLASIWGSYWVNLRL